MADGAQCATMTLIVTMPKLPVDSWDMTEGRRIRVLTTPTLNPCTAPRLVLFSWITWLVEGTKTPCNHVHTYPNTTVNTRRTWDWAVKVSACSCKLLWRAQMPIGMRIKHACKHHTIENHLQLSLPNYCKLKSATARFVLVSLQFDVHVLEQFEIIHARLRRSWRTGLTSKKTKRAGFSWRAGWLGAAAVGSIPALATFFPVSLLFFFSFLLSFKA